MKKTLLITTTLVVLALSATSIYAQVTTGTSIVDKMKAAAHSFTLSSVLNPTDTGLQSTPISGKKTGGILTAGEWNRVLELVSEGGSGGGSGWVDVPLTDTNPFDQQCMYRFVMQGQTYYAETVHEDRLYWINVMYFAKANKSVMVGGIAPFTVATKIEKLCGGGGATSAGGGATIVEGGIIKTSAKTISNWDLITLEGSWNSGGGDAAPTGGYIYKLGGQTKLAYVEASGISKDIVLTTTAQNVHNLTVKLSGDSVVIDPSSSNTLAYLVWKMGGSGGSSSSPAFYYCTNAQSLDSTNTPCYGASRNQGLGDGRYRVMSCRIRGSTGHESINSQLLNFGRTGYASYQNKWNSLYTDGEWQLCVEGSVLVVDTQASGGGGSGATSSPWTSSCPTGMSLVGTAGTRNAFCIETNVRTGTIYHNAAANCRTAGKSLCTYQQWTTACLDQNSTNRKPEPALIGVHASMEWILGAQTWSSGAYQGGMVIGHHLNSGTPSCLNSNALDDDVEPLAATVKYRCCSY